MEGLGGSGCGKSWTVCKERKVDADGKDQRRNRQHMQPVDVRERASAGRRQEYSDRLVLGDEVERIYKDVVSKSQSTAFGLKWVNRSEIGSARNCRFPDCRVPARVSG